MVSGATEIEPSGCAAASSTDDEPREVKQRSISIMTAHELLGHQDESRTRATAKQLGLTLKPGSFQPCVHYDVAKSRRKALTDQGSQENMAAAPGGRMFLDITSIRKPKDVKGRKEKILFVSKPHMRMMVDEYTGMRFLQWYKTKDAMVEPTAAQFYQWTSKGLAIKIVRCDNAGENKVLEKICKGSKWKLVIDFEYTARDTPQQNHLAEIGITVICNLARAMMSRACVPQVY